MGWISVGLMALGMTVFLIVLVVLATTSSMSSRRAPRALVRRHIEDGFNRDDWTVCQSTLADDYTAYYGAEGKANVGRDATYGRARSCAARFPT